MLWLAYCNSAGVRGTRVRTRVRTYVREYVPWYSSTTLRTYVRTDTYVLIMLCHNCAYVRTYVRTRVHVYHGTMVLSIHVYIHMYVLKSTRAQKYQWYTLARVPGIAIDVYGHTMVRTRVPSMVRTRVPVVPMVPATPRYCNSGVCVSNNPWHFPASPRLPSVSPVSPARTAPLGGRCCTRGLLLVPSAVEMRVLLLLQRTSQARRAAAVATAANTTSLPVRSFGVPRRQSPAGALYRAVHARPVAQLSSRRPVTERAAPTSASQQGLAGARVDPGGVAPVDGSSGAGAGSGGSAGVGGTRTVHDDGSQAATHVVARRLRDNRQLLAAVGFLHDHFLPEHPAEWQIARAYRPFMMSAVKFGLVDRQASSVPGDEAALVLEVRSARMVVLFAGRD
jgi:hypothetical protein